MDMYKEEKVYIDGTKPAAEGGDDEGFSQSDSPSTTTTNCFKDVSASAAAMEMDLQESIQVLSYEMLGMELNEPQGQDEESWLLQMNLSFPRTEKQRRELLNDKYKALWSLIPNPTKPDRASVVGDAIEYIQGLLRTVNEIKVLVEKKRSCGRDHKRGSGRHNKSPRSFWMQIKSQGTEVDVWIIDYQVTIKLLVQRQNTNCLLFVSKLLPHLHLDLHHVAGGHVGDYSTFLFYTKIYEGCSVDASAIANKLIEVVDKH